MSALFAECARCHHPRFDHPTLGPCRGCITDRDLHVVWLELPATAEFERDLPEPPICEAFVTADEMHDYAGSMQGGEEEEPEI